MDRFEIQNVSRTMLAQRELEASDAENLADFSETKACSRDVCGVIWKPVTAESDLGDKLE